MRQNINKTWYGDIEKRITVLNTTCKYTCNHCGSRTFILGHKDKVICRNCGRYVFKNNREEFRYRLNLTLSR